MFYDPHGCFRTSWDTSAVTSMTSVPLTASDGMMFYDASAFNQDIGLASRRLGGRGASRTCARMSDAAAPRPSTQRRPLTRTSARGTLRRGRRCSEPGLASFNQDIHRGTQNVPGVASGGVRTMRPSPRATRISGEWRSTALGI